MAALILRWRLFRYIFNSDIEKMCRQILVSADHTKYQRIDFRLSPNQPISLYELKTVTFSINCARYLAIRTLLQLSNNYETSYPAPANSLRDHMYVDDVFALAKTRVDPIKTMSLPRLELFGAVLLAEIIKTIINNLYLGQLLVHL